MYSYSNALDFSHSKYNSQSILIISSSVDLPTQSLKWSIKIQDFLDPDSITVSPECWYIHYLNSRDFFSFGSEEIQNRVGIHYSKGIPSGERHVKNSKKSLIIVIYCSEDAELHKKLLRNSPNLPFPIRA